jgi:hypothetical protein
MERTLQGVKCGCQNFKEYTLLRAEVHEPEISEWIDSFNMERALRESKSVVKFSNSTLCYVCRRSLPAANDSRNGSSPSTKMVDCNKKDILPERLLLCEPSNLICQPGNFQAVQVATCQSLVPPQAFAGADGRRNGHARKTGRPYPKVRILNTALVGTASVGDPRLEAGMAILLLLRSCSLSLFCGGGK